MSKANFLHTELGKWTVGCTCTLFFFFLFTVLHRSIVETYSVFMLNILFHPHLIIKDMSYNRFIIKKLLLVLGENLSTVHQATLSVLAAVDKVGVVQS